jgi:type IV fimbrial biogenesis protein FimT
MHTLRTGRAPGFTLMELMAAVTIAGILLTLAVPSYQNVRRNNQLIADANGYVSTLQFARTEAVRRGKNIHISAINSTDNASEYGTGLTVWFDSNSNGNLDANEELRVLPKAAPGIAVDSNSNHSALSFSARGDVDGPDEWLICDDRSGETGRRVAILASGMLEISKYACP